MIFGRTIRAIRRVPVWTTFALGLIGALLTKALSRNTGDSTLVQIAIEVGLLVQLAVLVTLVALPYGDAAVRFTLTVIVMLNLVYTVCAAYPADMDR
jgi:hypothetical protein